MLVGVLKKAKASGVLTRFDISTVHQGLTGLKRILRGNARALLSEFPLAPELST